MRVERDTEPQEASAEFGLCGSGGSKPEAKEMTWTLTKTPNKEPGNFAIMPTDVSSH